MKVKKIVLWTLLAVIGIPVLAIAGIFATVAVLDRSTGSIVVDGEPREYLLHVPASYDPARPTPLVISLHGAMNWPAYQMKVSRWNEAADAHGFLVVYPGGMGSGPKTWFMRGQTSPAEMPDVRFIAALIDTLEARYHVDPARIYANGLSNGGGMAFVLSCTLSDRIAAIGAVAAAQSLPFRWCRDTTPVPMIAFHGDSDHIVPYLGGKVAIAPEPFPAIRDWVADWARRDRCGAPPVDSVVAIDVSRLSYPGCAGGADVVLYTIAGGGHAWPGGMPMPAWIVGRTTNTIDATAIMWSFFLAHPLPADRTPAARR